MNDCVSCRSWDFYKEGCDDEPAVHTQTWATYFAGWQYLPGSCYLKHVRNQINAVARWADAHKLDLLGLGAFNKAEWVNHGGDDIVDAVKPMHTRIAHGNT